MSSGTGSSDGGKQGAGVQSTKGELEGRSLAQGLACLSSKQYAWSHSQALSPQLLSHEGIFQATEPQSQHGHVRPHMCPAITETS